MKCRSAMRRRASPRCASAAAWASPCASHATKQTAADRWRDEKISSQSHTAELIKTPGLVPGVLSLMSVDGPLSSKLYKKPIKNLREGFQMARVALVTGGTRGI